MQIDWRGKLEYADKSILPALGLAFQRGDRKYRGVQHSHSKHHVGRTAVADIEHVRRCHVDVRLAEAEDAADLGDLVAALVKIESTIGYLVILHMRTAQKLAENRCSCVVGQTEMLEAVQKHNPFKKET